MHCEQSVVVYDYNPSAGKAEAGGSRVPGLSLLHRKSLSQKTKNKQQQNVLV
jgi:hypothetical protein